MAEVPGINNNAPMRPPYVDQMQETAKGLGLSEEGVQQIREVLTLLGAESSVRVSNKSAAATNQDVGTQTGATGIPALDNPADPEAVRADLEKLIAYLKLENDQQQAEMAKERIDLQKGELERRHGEQVEKLKESLAEMDKAAKASLATKIFGWLMAALAVVFAVVASIATGGAAVGAIVGAVVAIGMAVANETGAMEKLTEKLADALKDAGLSKMASQILAAVIVALASIVLSVGSGAAAGGIANAVTKTAEAAAKVATSGLQLAAQTAKGIMNFVMGAMGLTTTGVGIGSTVQGYKAGMAQADLTEMEKFLAILQQQLEESQEELNAILEALQNTVSNIIAILDSETDTQNEIAQQMGAMA